MSNSWSMEDIISGTEKKEEPTKMPEAPKSTLQMLAAAKPKTDLTPVTLVRGVRGVTGVREVTPLTPVTVTNIKTEPYPVAPVKNFQKVSNSITKQAIPARVFKSGKSKELYDVLYSLTRGSINPARTIKISKPKLQKLAGIGAPQTLNQGLMHLQIVGLIRIANEAPGGKHEGHEYEVFLYEETGTGLTPLTPVSGVTNLPHLPDLQSNSTYPSLNVENTTISDEAKTFIKTNTKNDDEEASTFIEMNKKLSAAVKKITGKKVSKSEAAKWGTLADVLILELEIAASRADGVSSVPAFLTEVLRRQFFSARQQKPYSKPNKVKRDMVGKSENISYEIKPLDADEREATVEHLREFVDSPYLMDFEKWYTPEDWEWVFAQLKVK